MNKSTIKSIAWYPVNVGELKSKPFVMLEHMIGDRNVFKFLKIRDSIYSDGFFLDWGEANKIFYCVVNGYKEEEITRIIKAACVCGLVHQDMFEWYGIITSLEIQTNFFRVWKRRENESIIHEYLVFPKSTLGKFVSDKSVIVNLKDEVLNIKNLPSINRPKKKVYTIQTPNLFLPASDILEISAERQSLFDKAVLEIGNLKTEEQPVEIYIKQTTPWEEIVKISSTAYNDLPPHIKKDINEAYFHSYFKIIQRIDNNYSSLHKHNNPITWKEWKSFLMGCTYLEEQVHGGLEKMAASNVSQDGTMMASLVRYIKWYIDPNWDKEKSESSINKNGSANPGIKIISDARIKK